MLQLGLPNATSRTVVGSNPNDIIEIFQFTKSCQLHHGPGVYSASNRNEYQKNISGGKERPACKADKLLATCEPIV
jgi:hypothetical protein